MLYQYPKETDPHFAMSIRATRKARELGLPVLVLFALPGSRSRQIQFGWITDDDPEARHLLVKFGDEPPPAAPHVPGASGSFKIQKRTRDEKRQVLARIGQPQFQMDVFKAYGPKCAVCNIDLLELLDAAHIVA